MGLALKKDIVNYQFLKENLKDFRGNLKIDVPCLHIQRDVDFIDMNSLKDVIYEMSTVFPHNRVAVTYKSNGEEVKLEIHPVTGAA